MAPAASAAWATAGFIVSIEICTPGMGAVDHLDHGLGAHDLGLAVDRRGAGPRALAADVDDRGAGGDQRVGVGGGRGRVGVGVAVEERVGRDVEHAHQLEGRASQSEPRWTAARARVAAPHPDLSRAARSRVPRARPGCGDSERHRRARRG